MKRLIVRLRGNKEVENAGWLIGGKIVQMFLSFAIGLWTARYLGPANYGLINYVSAYTALFASFCTLGISPAVLMGELTNRFISEGTTLGTTLGLRFFSSVLSSFLIVFIVSIVDRGENTTVQIAIVCCLGILFQNFYVFEVWFQKRYMSKITALSALLGYCISSIYKVYLLIYQKSVVLFAFASFIEYIVIAVFLCASYKREKGPQLVFSFAYGKDILSRSYHFIISGMMVAIYGQTDRIMLKHMLSEAEVGYYSTAYSLVIIWTFVLSAVITSMTPAIMKYKNEGDEENYLRKNRMLYSIIFYLSVGVSLVFTVFAPIIIRVLYGMEYINSVTPLRIITWFVAFSYLGVARDNWLVCEEKQRFTKYIYLIACVANIVMNLLFIPVFGPSGAALASLITQILTSIGIPLFFKELRPNVKLIFDGILLRGIHSTIT